MTTIDRPATREALWVTVLVAAIGGCSTSAGQRTSTDSGADAASAPAADGDTNGDGGGAGPDSAGIVSGNWVPGDYPPGLADQTYLDITGVAGQQGLTRQYKVHVPPGYDRNVPAPVVFCLHGLMQNAVSFCVNGAGLPGKSDAEGFILIMPLGHQNSWNGGDCCGGAQSMGLDDVALIRAIFEAVAGHLNVDRRRVYTTGFSNGAYLSYRLACEAADLFVAAAPGSGGAPTPCNPSKPVSILDIHGTADGYVNYNLQKPSLDTLATRNGCQLVTGASALPPSGGDTTCVSYGGCPSGVEVTGCTIQGGGHVWFGDPGCGTGVGPIGCVFVGANSDFMANTDSIWKFFSRLSR